MSRSPYLVNRAFRTFAASTILAVMATTLGSVVNGIIVGNMMGHEALSAVNLVSPLVQLYNAVTALVCAGGAVLCAVLVGKGETGRTGGIFASAVVMLAVLSVVFALIGMAMPDAVAGALCSSEELLPLVTDYARVSLIGAAAFMFLPGLAMFVRVDGSPGTATVALIVANVLSAVLCIMSVHAGLGMTGASAAMVVGFAVGAAIIASHFVRNRNTTLFRPEAGGSRYVPQMLLFGAPVALASLMMVAKILCMNNLTLTYLGEAGMATMSVAMNVMMLGTMVIGGTCQTIQPVGGTLYGSGDMDGISYLTRTMAKVLLVSLGLLAALVILVPGLFCALFGVTDPSLVESSAPALRVFAPSVILYGVNYAIMILFQVLGNRKISIAVSVLQPLMVMGIAVSTVGFDADMIWASFLLGELAMLAVTFVISLEMRRRNPALHGFLLGRMPAVPTAVLSVRGDGSDIGEALDSISSFLESNGVPKDRADRAVLCCEELSMNVCEHALKGDPDRYMDIVVRAGDEASVTVRDDGALFNPMAFDGSGKGLLIAKGMCTSMAYSRALGQNNVRFTF